jgi:hypothetical protein
MFCQNASIPLPAAEETPQGSLKVTVVDCIGDATGFDSLFILKPIHQFKSFQVACPDRFIILGMSDSLGQAFVQGAGSQECKQAAARRATSIASYPKYGSFGTVEARTVIVHLELILVSNCIHDSAFLKDHPLNNNLSG